LQPKRTLLVVVVLLAVGIALATWPRGIPPSATLLSNLEATPGGLQWYRGNLHAHTTRSDGDADAAQVAAWYRGHGYQFLAITDHDALSPPSVLAADPHWLLLRGEEVSDAVGTTSVHLNAIGARTQVPAQGGADVVAAVQADVDAGRRAGALMQVNHPNFTYSITAEQLMRVRGTNLFELYNGHPLSHNAGDVAHPSTERLWDIALAFRLASLHLPLLYGTATDDAHNYRQPPGDASPGRGWVMVLADRLTPAALATALRAGRFYASTGVRLASVQAYDRGLRVQVAAEPGVRYRIEFIGTRRGFDTRSTAATGRDGSPVYASRRYSPDIGRILATEEDASAEYVFDPDDLYVRARVTSTRPHPDPSQPLQFEQAWTQPVAGPAAHGAMVRGLAAPAAPAVALHAALAAHFQPLDAARSASLHGAAKADCGLDLLGNGHGTRTETLTPQDNATLGGWIADRGRKVVPDSAGVWLQGPANYLADAPNGVRRPDVAKALGNAGLEGVGFNVSVPLGPVAPGDYAVNLLAWYGSDAVVCVTGKRLRVSAP
jgi:hypothetical protein